ncbi:MAG: O-acetyl-ADP-ribose deacetylase [Thermodesulfobacteriota bacterium]
MERFTLTDECTLIVREGDLTQEDADAIVNAANQRMLGGGGVDGAIHRAAGKELLEACRAVPEVRPDVRCPTGEARITPGFALRARHVIHTVGPVYASAAKSAPLLRSAYRSSLELANAHGLRTIAFPAISCGVYGYPAEEAAEVAIATCAEHAGALREVRFVLLGEAMYRTWCDAARAYVRK